MSKVAEMKEVLSWVFAILAVLWWSILWTMIYPYYVLKSLVKHKSPPSYLTTLLLLMIGRFACVITLSAINTVLARKE